MEEKAFLITIRSLAFSSDLTFCGFQEGRLLAP
jgi:hypothetical protein